VIADSTGTAVWRHDNTEPFSDSVPDENPSGLGAFEFPLRFPGQYFDKETGNSQNWMRDYAADLGRYQQADPIGLSGGISLYLYVGANPLSAIDRSGLAVEGPRTNLPGIPIDDAMSKTVGGVEGKKCSEKISCDFYKRAQPGQLEGEISKHCEDLIESGGFRHHYPNCMSACKTWLKIKCQDSSSSCPTNNSV
jgi:RHS repeat-associated protein